MAITPRNTRRAVGGAPSSATVTAAAVSTKEVVAPPVEVKQSAGSPAGQRPSADEVRRRAYEIYLRRRVTGSPGGPESDWLQAERELRAIA